MTGHAGQVRAVVTGTGSLEIKWPLNPPTTSRPVSPHTQGGGLQQKQKQRRRSSLVFRFLVSFVLPASCVSPASSSLVLERDAIHDVIGAPREAQDKAVEVRAGELAARL